MYLYYVSGYFYLKNFYTTDARPYMPSILERYSASCQGLSEFAQAACVLNGLSKKYSISIANSRQDEGGSEETKLDVANVLSEDNIKVIKAWQAKEWQQHR